MSGLRAAFATFSALPVGAGKQSPSGRVLLWFPVVGVVLGTLAWAASCAAWRGYAGGAPLLAAALVVSSLALLTRGLHLDGLADLADGLGSGQPPEPAREIMHRGDVGAFGAAAVALVLLVQVAALTEVLESSPRWGGLVTIVAGTTLGRVAVLRAAGLPAAPDSAFGVLVAGSAGPAIRWSATVLAVVAAALLAAWTPVGPVTGLGAAVAALALADLLCRHAVARLGGVSGDVFGALVEVGTTVFWVGWALGEVWR
jgi:adenosylcobinamide-GDP ribazoletransferase